MKFDERDYVAVAIAAPQNLSKLQTRWNGPYQITEAVLDWVFLVKHLVSKAEKTVHGSRLQFHSEKYLDVPSDSKNRFSARSGSSLSNPSKMLKKRGKNTKSRLNDMVLTNQCGNQ